MERALIHWHGGKFRIADWIISHFPEHKLYIEPFGGAASVLLRKRPTNTEVYNDLDNRLFRVFKTIREQPEELAQSLSMTLFCRKELHLCYESDDYDRIDDVEFARRFITMSHLAISSTSMNEMTGFRSAVNSSLRSAPTGKGDYCSQAGTFYRLPEVVFKIRERLANVIIENTGYDKLIQRFDRPGCLWYFDPPYLPATRSKSSNRRGYKHSMSIEDHEQLLEQLLNLQGNVALSGYDNDLYNSTLKGWRKVSTDAMTDGRIKKMECLWMNYESDQKQMNLF